MQSSIPKATRIGMFIHNAKSLPISGWPLKVNYKRMKTDFISAIPVLPSKNIARDLDWYSRNFGFVKTFGDNKYAGMRLEEIEIHLQWNADTTEDPLLGGSVVRIFVRNIEPYFESLVIKGIIKCDKLIRNTTWGTHEFGLYDPNDNAIFIVEDIASSAEKTS